MGRQTRVYIHNLFAIPVKNELTINELSRLLQRPFLPVYPDPFLFSSLQRLPNSLHVLSVLADGHRRKVELVHRFGNRLQACDGPLSLPVDEDVAGKDGGACQGKDHQEQPDEPGGKGSLEQILNSFKKYI